MKNWTGIVVLVVILLVGLLCGWLIFSVGGPWGDRTQGFLVGVVATVVAAFWIAGRSDNASD